MGEGGVELAFQFWDFDVKYCTRNKFEAMNLVFERVYIISKKVEDSG